jgi:hypothetical protein
MKTTLSQKLLMLLALAGAGAGTAQAAFVNVGTANGTNQTANSTNAAITDGNLISADQRWTRDNVYILRRVIQVANGATLTIEPGTIIRGVTAGTPAAGVANSGITGEAGALLVARGGKIVANGTADSPIIFTSIDDPNVPGGYNTVPPTFTPAPAASVAVTILSSGLPQLNNSNYAPNGPQSNNGFAKAARWGGVIMCGFGYVAQGTSASPDANTDGIWDGHAAALPTFPPKFSPTPLNPGEIYTQPGANQNIGVDYVEGFATNAANTIYNPAGSAYGGLDDTDNSGVLRFVSIRYGGFILGTNNEINSLTVCACGTGTVLEHVESWQNQDDGFEWFGGKNNSRYLFSIANQDDSFDGDEGYRGVNQFWVAIQGTLNTAAPSLRSGWTVTNDPVGQNITDATNYGYLELFEWDGGEGNNADRLPKTDIKAYNCTLLAGNTYRGGIQAKLEAQVGLYNAVVENVGAGGVSRGTANNPPGSVESLLTMENIHSFTTAVPTLTEVGTITNNGSTVLSSANFSDESSSQIASPWFPTATNCPLYQYKGMNPVLEASANARADDGVATPAGFIDAPFAGALRDNNHLKGWSTLDYLQALPDANVTRPFVTVGLSGTNPTVNFTAVSGLRYAVERSTNGKNWTLVQKAPVTGSGAVSLTDTATTVGAPVIYRVYAL